MSITYRKFVEEQPEDLCELYSRASRTGIPPISNSDSEGYYGCDDALYRYSVIEEDVRRKIRNRR